jgi:ketosteroid isomerase-like protein
MTLPGVHAVRDTPAMVADADVELIARMIREWNSGDVDALLDVFDSEVEVRPALSTFLASMVYRGHDGVRSWYAETNEPWAELQAEPERFIDAGECTVVVISLHARVPGGTVDVDAEIAHVVTIRDGRIVRLDGYDEPDAALAAVGLAR